MHYSPLRYPGGKGKITPFMKDVIETNNIFDGTYIEPFAGGAGVALNLLIEGYVNRIMINDVDRSIFAFWDSILKNTEEFCELVLNTELNINEWKHQREIQSFKEKAEILELGFSTFYLNRTNHSGIINGGVIGGLAQKGKWKMNARYNKGNLIERIYKIAENKKNIQIYNKDALDFIKQDITNTPHSALIYYDPPYFHKGQKLYVNHYNPKDHSELCKAIVNDKQHHWILTYDNTPEIMGLYSKYQRLKYSLNYSAANNGLGSELMFFSSNCKIPENIRLNISADLST